MRTNPTVEQITTFSRLGKKNEFAFLRSTIFHPHTEFVCKECGERINTNGHEARPLVCPNCKNFFIDEVRFL
jgi:predicted Zn-ribbon and HTH transcriptional regulator